jgi:hypothetical protein
MTQQPGRHLYHVPSISIFLLSQVIRSYDFVAWAGSEAVKICGWEEIKIWKDKYAMRWCELQSCTPYWLIPLDPEKIDFYELLNPWHYFRKFCSCQELKKKYYFS